MAEVSSTSVEVTTLPDEENAPEPQGTPDGWEEINNLAGDDVLCEQVRRYAHTQIEYFRGQDQRQKFVDTGGTMDVADRMLRVALRRKESSDQHEDTASNVASTMFFSQVNTIFASICSILFPHGSEEPPAVYEPEIKSNDFKEPTQAKWVAEQQNMVEQFTRDEDKREKSDKETLFWTLVYGNQVVAKEWDFCEEEKTERVPTDYDDDGWPVGYKFKTAKRITKACPTNRVPRMENMFFDAQLDDMDLQRVIGERQQVAYEEQIKEPQILNINKISNSHLDMGNYDADIATDRGVNAGTNAVPEKTGLLERWQVEVMAPIREYKLTGRGARKGKGKWDAGKAVPTRYWATFIGDIGSAKAVCIRLVKGPYHHGRSRYSLRHSHRDNNGAYHMGWASILEPLYWQETTNINQAIDNVTLRTRTPYTANGPIESNNLTARANGLIKIGRFTDLKPLATEKTTDITMSMAGWIEAKAKAVTNASNPIQGEIAFARTAATEAKQNFEQATLPIDEQTAFWAEQHYPWDLELDALLWRQYANNDVERYIMRGAKIEPIYPERLWGPIKTKVVAVSRFRNSTIRRQEINAFLQNSFAQFAPIMGEQGQRVFAQQIWEIFGFDKGSEIFPEDGDYDARIRAVAVLNSIVHEGQWTEPQQQENQLAYLSILKPFAAEYANLPKDQIDQGRLRLLNQQILMREHMMAEKAPQPGADQEQGMNANGGLPAEIVSDQAEAQAGAVANA